MCFPFTHVIVSYCLSLFYLLLFTSFSFLVDISKHHHEFRLSFQSNYTLYSYSQASPLTGSVLFSQCPFIVLNSPTNTVRFLSVSLQYLPSGLSPSLAKYHIQCHVTLFLPAAVHRAFSITWFLLFGLFKITPSMANLTISVQCFPTVRLSSL